MRSVLDSAAMRRGLTLLLFVGTSLLFVGVAPARAANDVDIVDFAFSPPSITVNPGDTVTWHQKGHVGHSVTSDEPGGFDSSPGCDPTPDNDNCLKPLDTYSVTFQSPGTFTYHCKVHSSMTGSVTVLGEDTSSTTTPVTEPPTTSVSPTASTTTSTSSTTTTSTSTTTTSTTTTTTTLASSASAPITVKNKSDDGGSSTVPLLIGAAVFVAGLAVLAYWLGLRRRPLHPGGPGTGEPPPTVQGPRI